MRRKKKRAARLAEFRERRGFTRAELARRAGVGVDTVCRAEAGSPVTWREINALSYGLAILPQQLLGGRGPWEESLDYPRYGPSWEETVEREIAERYESLSGALR